MPWTRRSQWRSDKQTKIKGKDQGLEGTARTESAGYGETAIKEKGDGTDKADTEQDIMDEGDETEQNDHVALMQKVV